VQATRLLVKELREALSAKDDRGLTPLDAAWSRGSVHESEKVTGVEVTKLFVDSFPGALTVGGNEGRTPLRSPSRDDETP
jgi:hypothetical protein